MRIFRRPRDSYEDPAATDFMWGVPRREGHSDTDDPSAHAGLIQHAFEFGRDDRAICGFEPPKRTSRAYSQARSQLAVPGRDNPKCRKCELLITSRVHGNGAVPVMAATGADAGPESGGPETGVPATDVRAAGPAAESRIDHGRVGDRELSAPASRAHQEPAPVEAQSIEEAHAPAEVEVTTADGGDDEGPDDQATEGQTVEEQPTGDQPTDDRQREDERTEDQQTEDQQTEDQPAHDPAAIVDAADQLRLEEQPYTQVEDDARDEPTAFDSFSRARDPGFQPRSHERARRRSVRRGGTVLVGPGRRSVVIEIPISTDIAGIVANVETSIDDVRVEAVTVGNDGAARVTLNRPAPSAVEVAWYIVSNPFRESA